MRSLILAFLSLALLGCATPCGGSGGMIVRSPIEFFSDPTTSTVSRSVVGAPVVHELRVVESNARCVAPGERVGPYRVVGP